MDFEAVIGIEIHVALKTRSKMFSAAPNRFSHEPNTLVAPFDLSLPGTMPAPNKEAVISALRVASLLHMRIDPLLRFDRKNYFYPDMPKGYQITQYYHPLGVEGYVEIMGEDGSPKRVKIHRLHLEEDACKQTHLDSCSLLDYNRAGTPLIEIVSAPDIHSASEAKNYIEAIRNAVVYAYASDGKMENGSLRADVNVSLRPLGSDKLGEKTELKNLNSLKNVGIAIEDEISRQTAILVRGGVIAPETRRFNEAIGKTVSLRQKEQVSGYRYAVEPNIVPIRLSEAFIHDALATAPESYESKLRRYLSFGLSREDAYALLRDIHDAEYFDIALGDGKYAKSVANLLLVDVRSFLNEKGISIEELSFSPSSLYVLASYLKEGYSHQQIVQILKYCLEENLNDVPKALRLLNIEKPSNDEDFARKVVVEVLNLNPSAIADFHAGKDRALGFLIGQVIKASKGKINPAVAGKIVKEELERR